MRVRRAVGGAGALVLATALAVPVGASAAAAPGAAPGARQNTLSARTAAQIDALAAAKEARTPLEQKVDSSLLAALGEKAQVRAAAPALRSAVATTKGAVSVEIRGHLTSASLRQVRSLGGRVTAPATAGTVRATVPLSDVMKVAALPGVTHVAPAVGALTASMRGPGAKTALSRPSKDAAASKVAGELRSALRAAPQAAAAPAIGAVESEAVKVEAVDRARARTGVTGAGVTIGVLSDGVDSLAVSQATGDLPSDVTVLDGQAGSGDEGTAMLELAHDVAPGADLAFATAFDGEQSFADNIRALRAAGADIIVDDVIYFDESPFQDGPVAQAVNDVTADGALYFSSSGNEGNLDDGTSGTWEGDFLPAGPTALKIAGRLHDFNPSAATQDRDPLSVNSEGAPVDLFWADPLGRSRNDYDVYVINQIGNVVAFSNDTQAGTQDPYEITFVPFAETPGERFSVVVVKFKGANRFLHLDVLRGRFAANSGLTPFSTSGELRGHAAAADAYAVAAAPAAAPLPFSLEPGDPPNPAGPFPRPFTATQQSEPYTSDGLRRIFFSPTGQPLTPGNFSSTGGVVRQKPDVTAADGVSTSVFGFETFYGTSAAAPNAAAIASLVLSGNPGITPAAVRSAITGTALDIEAAGTDRDTGAGIVMADRLLDRTGATPQPLVEAGDAVLGTTTDGDGFLEPGESGQVNVPVTNVGDSTATQVRVALTSATPGVTVTPTFRSYGNVAKGATKSAAQPWTVSIPAGFPVGQPIELTATVTFVGSLSPTHHSSRLPTGEPATTATDVAYAGPPVAIPDDDVAGASVPISVTGVGPLSRVTFSVDGEACSTAPGATTVGVDHTFVGDLIGRLVSPAGTSVTLFDQVGSGGNNICQAVLDDSATRSIQDAVSLDAPFTGTWAPTQPLGALRGENADGTWTFNVVDSAAVDTGTIRAVSLHLFGFVPPGT